MNCEKAQQQSLQWKGKWLSIGHNVHQSQSYQYVYRSTPKVGKHNLNGVQVVPILQFKTHTQIIFIANFRPSVGSFVIQFPAGLAQDDNLQQNAQRQLQQQTGYTAYKFIDYEDIPLYADPWKSNQSGKYFVALIDGEDKDCWKKKQSQATQNIRTFKLKAQNICEQITKISKQKQYLIDAKTWLVCLGFQLKQQLKDNDIRF